MNLRPGGIMPWADRFSDAKLFEKSWERDSLLFRLSVLAVRKKTEFSHKARNIVWMDQFASLEQSPESSKVLLIDPNKT